MGSHYNSPARVETVGRHLSNSRKMTIKDEAVRIAAFSGYTGDRL